nr:class I SAM-dependent methyltransferase [Myxococcales bacterium]
LIFFEVDQQTVQDHKRSALAQAGIDTTDTRFVVVDFSEDDLFEKLVSAGYDPTVETIFLWEGVTLYLSEEAVRHTMGLVRANAAPGSVLLADIYARRLIDIGRSRVGSKALDYTGEGFGFGLPLDEDHESVLHTFVQSEELSVGQTFFLGSASRKGPFSAVVEMIV